MIYIDFDNEFGPQLPKKMKFVSEDSFNVDLFRIALSKERSDSHKRFNQIIKEIFSKKEVAKCVDADEADA